MILYKVYRVCVLLSIYNLLSNVKKRIFHSSRAEVALLRYIVFYFESGCDTSEPHVNYISGACSSLVRQPYYTPNCIISKIRSLETILATEKCRLDGRTFLYGRIHVDFSFLAVHKVCTKARLLGERSVRIREVKGSNPSRSTNLPHRFVRCGVFYA